VGAALCYGNIENMSTKYESEKFGLVGTREIGSPQPLRPIVENFYNRRSWIRGISKLAHLPIYLFLVMTTDTIKVSTSKHIDRYGNFDHPTQPSSVVNKFAITRHLLQRVILLDAKRMSRSGKKLHQVRQKINVGTSQGMVVRRLEGDEVEDRINEIIFERKWKQRCTDIFLLPKPDSEIKIVGIGIYDIDGKLISVSASLISGELAKNFLCLTVERGASRWLATESMFDLLYEHGVRVVTTVGLVGMDAGNYFFQQKLGYITRNIKYMSKEIRESQE